VNRLAFGGRTLAAAAVLIAGACWLSGCSDVAVGPPVCTFPPIGPADGGSPAAAIDAGAIDGAASDAGTPALACGSPAATSNLFADVLRKTDTQVDDKVDAAFQSLFHGGDDATVYYPVGDDQAYILDVYDNDVRTEGMSYGMMIAVQLDKKPEFDRLWTWAKQHMFESSGALSGYFAWQRMPSGDPISASTGPAPDGEEYFATALIFASRRWGDGTGIYDYGSEARALLDVMIHKGEDPAAQAVGVTSMFDPKQKLVVYVPSSWASFTDPSYVMPAFYDVWACFDTDNTDFWRQVAANSRAFFPKATHPMTGLAPELASFNGTPSSFGGKGDFRFDAWRVVMNVMADHHYRGVDPWQTTYAARLATFFAAQGDYGNQYTLAGNQLGAEHSAGLVALNGTLGFGLDPAAARCFVQSLWDLPVPTGTYRYYNGLLYMLSLLHASGHFQLWM
jgi:oligosaccharide reducing-end xylanase